MNDTKYDVIVMGGGPGGIGAGLGSAKAGARTLLAEKLPILGGMGTAALADTFSPAHFCKERPVIGGVLE